MKKIIVPSAPFKGREELEGLAMKAKGEVKRIQIDVCDGKYVPSVSWPFTEYAKHDFENLKKRDDFDVYLPFWESINYTVDLMVEHPEKYIESFVLYGIDEICVHFRSLGNDPQIIFDKVVELAKQYELNLVLAVDTKTDNVGFLEFLKVEDCKNLKLISGLQVMGIEKIGFQGQEFATESLDIVKVFKKQFSNIPIYFDGAISEETISEISEAGVDVFCVGSYLTKAANFEENLQILKKMI